MTDNFVNETACCLVMMMMSIFLFFLWRWWQLEITNSKRLENDFHNYFICYLFIVFDIRSVCLSFRFLCVTVKCEPCNNNSSLFYLLFGIFVHSFIYFSFVLLFVKGRRVGGGGTLCSICASICDAFSFGLFFHTFRPLFSSFCVHFIWAIRRFLLKFFQICCFFGGSHLALTSIYTIGWYVCICRWLISNCEEKPIIIIVFNLKRMNSKRMHMWVCPNEFKQ